MIRSWRKVLESDLPNLVIELKEAVKRPAVIILSGPVGAGKTTFTKSFIAPSSGQVLSPTYSLINENGDTAHADFYRLESAEEIVHLELDLYLEDKDFFLVEWGKDYLREITRYVGRDFHFYELSISINDNESRDFVLTSLES